MRILIGAAIPVLSSLGVGEFYLWINGGHPFAYRVLMAFLYLGTGLGGAIAAYLLPRPRGYVATLREIVRDPDVPGDISIQASELLEGMRVMTSSPRQTNSFSRFG